MKKRTLPLIIVVLTAIMLLSGCKGGNSSSKKTNLPAERKAELKAQEANFNDTFVDSDKDAAQTYIGSMTFSNQSSYYCDWISYLTLEGSRDYYYENDKLLFDNSDPYTPKIYCHGVIPLNMSFDNDHLKVEYSVDYTADVYFDYQNCLTYIETKVNDEDLDSILRSEADSYYGKIKTPFSGNVSDVLPMAVILPDYNMTFDFKGITDLAQRLLNLEIMVNADVTVFTSDNRALKIISKLDNGDECSFTVKPITGGYTTKTEWTNKELGFTLLRYMSIYRTTDRVTMPWDKSSYTYVENFEGLVKFEY